MIEVVIRGKEHRDLLVDVIVRLDTRPEFIDFEDLESMADDLKQVLQGLRVVKVEDE